MRITTECARDFALAKCMAMSLSDCGMAGELGLMLDNVGAQQCNGGLP